MLQYWDEKYLGLQTWFQREPNGQLVTWILHVININWIMSKWRRPELILQGIFLHWIHFHAVEFVVWSTVNKGAETNQNCKKNSYVIAQQFLDSPLYYLKLYYFKHSMWRNKIFGNKGWRWYLIIDTPRKKML